MPTPITAESFLSHLINLGFTKEGHLFTKKIGSARLVVDSHNKTLHYPEDQGLVINERQSCNFLAPENFVVFECVNRLLEKGYHPRHIELEPKWKLGHGSSGGRADILVTDNLSTPLLIIECKTAGREFDRAWNATLRDGDQLFSYAQQISETQFLCLYTSFIENGTLGYTSHIIAHRDNEKYLAANPNFRAFKAATDVKNRHAIWRDTYKLDYTPGGIFEEAIQPYHIGKDKYSIADLKPISASDQQKQYHRFATILRQHNVSGRENAFDKLVNLLLCKLVDETENPDDLKFYWKGVAYDTHFELLDRLQQLYQRGMGKFLGEEITYINEGDVTNALKFIRQNPDATHRAVWSLFIQQKFFTNNDFSFIDVHNEKLFYQNADVLLKILQMWQDVRLVDETRHNQFLGDMFEGFLDQGVRQSEGQFFTPVPICRFLLMSLPLETLVIEQTAPPKSIDYACGAGHFLTELALQLKPLVAKHHPLRNIDDYHRAIIGIEKEYRLSKIAKVSAFMYQQPGIQICYADALIHDHEAYPEIKNGTFDILVANPPFSVKGFLETLPEEQRPLYQLTDTVNDSDTANSIETFFLERAAQLIKPGGIAALILPSSILSNGGSTYTRAREILLQSFDIAAIAEFGSGTFGKTGTNTVTLFLRRKTDHPDPATHYRERITEWFSGLPEDQGNEAVYQDAHLIAAYAAHIGVPSDDYKTLLHGKPSDALLAHETFAACVKEFEKSTETTHLKNQRKFKALTADEQTAELHKRRLAHLHRLEKDKLLHYILATGQDHPVLILKSPSDTKERRIFLGYDWSSAKGDEGIKLIKDATGFHLTPLYDEANRDNPEKISHAIAQNFRGELTDIPEALQPYLTLATLPSLLDFTRTSFEKQISLTAREGINATVESKWPIVKLGSVADYSSDRIEASNLSADTYVGVDNLLAQLGGRTKSSFVPSVGRITGYMKGDILLSNIRPYLKKIWQADNVGGASNDVLVLRGTNKEVEPSYLYAWLSRDAFFDYTMAAAKGAKMPRGDKQHILNYYIPIPPLEIQRQIVAECQAVHKQSSQARAAIEHARKSIDSEVATIYGMDSKRLQLQQIADLSRGASPRPIAAFITESPDGIPWIKIGDVDTRDKYIRRTAERITPEGAAKSRIVKPGDFIISNSMSVGRPYILAIEGCVHDGWLILSSISDKIDHNFLYYVISSDDAQAQFTQRALGGVVQNLNIDRAKTVSIPVPPLKDQKRFVKAVEEQETRITAAESILAATPARKAAILHKYL